MPTQCYFCKGHVTEQKIKVDFRWGRRLKIIENVPAGVLPAVWRAIFPLCRLQDYAKARRITGEARGAHDCGRG